MPRYKFQVFNDDHTMDPDGKELPDPAAAREYALKAARAIMGDELATHGEITLSHWIEIEDERGEMSVVTFADAVKINP